LCGRTQIRAMRQLAGHPHVVQLAGAGCAPPRRAPRGSPFATYAVQLLVNAERSELCKPPVITTKLSVITSNVLICPTHEKRSNC
jgi:hypothetical protein